MLFLAIVPIARAAFSDELYAEWEKVFESDTYDRSSELQKTIDGGFIIVGSTYSYESSQWDMHLIKIDYNGSKQWEKRFGGTSDDYGYSVQQTSDESYIIAGSTESFGSGKFDVHIIKTDSNGNIQWEKTFGGSNNDRGYSIQKTSDGGYIIAGQTNSFGLNWHDVYLIKIDSNGNIQWEKLFGGDQLEEAKSVRQTLDEGYVILGMTRSFGSDYESIYLVKTDSNGEMQWNKTFGGSNDDNGYFIQQTSDRGYMLLGTTKFEGRETDIYLIKTDSNGELQWDETFGGSNHDHGYFIQQTLDGYMIAGSTQSFGAGESDAYLIKIDSDGNSQWEKTFGGVEGDWGRSVQQTSDGGFLLLFNTESFGVDTKKIGLIKLSKLNCSDSIMNGDETDIDCGGSCDSCNDGKNCLNNSDCVSGYCYGNICSVDVNPLLKKYAPVLYFHPDEEFFPKSIDSMLNESDLMLDKLWTDDMIDEMPIAVESLGYDNVTEDYYLDMVDASGGYTGVNIPDPNRFHKYPYNVYGRVDNRHESLIVLQYWFFYPYNNWYNKHEGDWEMIQIILNKTIGDPIPLVATYSYHHDANTSDWINIEKINGTHPKVFVAKGGHASYWDLSERTYNTKKENVSQTGPKLVLNENYTLTEMGNSTDWINFLGTWGEPGSFGTGGPNSPANIRYNRNEPNRWDEPLKFAESTRSSDTTAIVASPVNLHAYDTEGGHVGLNEFGELELEIPELYLFLDEDKIKLIDIISSEPITFLIEATDNGTFNLSISNYDRDNSILVNIDYENINITNQTKAIVNMVPTNPYFIMEIDEDGDNITDTTVEPDNIAITGVYNRTITLNLKEEWNLISIPLILENNSVENVFKSINYSQIFSYDSSWEVPTNINYSMGMWIKVNEEANLTINGTLPFNPIFNLKQGRNLIGNPNLHISNVD